jgi:thiamine biosynthesis lipoprotein
MCISNRQVEQEQLIQKMELQLLKQSGQKKRKMQNWKNINFFVFLFVSFILLSCNGSVKSEIKFKDASKRTNSLHSKQFVFGNVNGLNYTIITGDEALLASKKEIEQILLNFQSVVSNLNPTSFTYQFNHSSGKVLSLDDTSHYFQDIFQISQQIYQSTSGAFNPSALFLTKKWGFDKKSITAPDSSQIYSFMKNVAFENGHLYTLDIKDNDALTLKKKKLVSFDFSGISNGLAVDYLCDFLSKKGNKNYFIEIEGKRKVKGRNKNGLQWQIGIDVPKKAQDGKESIRDFTKVVDLKLGAIATAGNYNSFYLKDNEKRSYTIDLRTGFPVDNKVLSATVWSDKCVMSDAYSHVFMVLGVNETVQFLKNNPLFNLEVLLIYSDENGNLARYETTGMKQMLGH